MLDLLQNLQLLVKSVFDNLNSLLHCLIFTFTLCPVLKENDLVAFFMTASSTNKGCFVYKGGILLFESGSAIIAACTPALNIHRDHALLREYLLCSFSYYFPKKFLSPHMI